jgi:hypothetical protein
MVEYSLVVAFLVVGSILAIDYLNGEASDEVANQADCVATRPPPEDCQINPIITTTVTADPSTTSTSMPDPTSSTSPPSTDPPQQPSTATWSGQSTSLPGGQWKATANPVVLNPDGTPKAGVTVRVRWSILDPNYPDIFPGECVTDAAGTCAIEFTPPFSDAVEVQATIFQIEADPSVATVPGALNFIKP